MSAVSALKEWQALSAHHDQRKAEHIADLFCADAGRFKNFSLTLPGICLDYSKTLLTAETRDLLLALAHGRNLEKLRDDMFSGVEINNTEKRAVLHTALRRKDAPAEVQEVLARMKSFSDAVRSCAWRGYSGKKITDIVNIGIGGSSLGPQLVAESLAAFHAADLRAHFVANVEASDLEGVLKKLSPDTTLFIVVSKTFTTAETLQNAEQARAWFVATAGKAGVDKHFAAVSTNVAAAENFGIAAANVFPLWDWVGGRYSVWSAVGLSVMLMIGAEKFDEFLAGAAAMDEHFKTAPLEKNMPVMLGLVGLWHRNFCGYPAYACIPYHAALRRLPAWLQQLDMESNGKSVDKNGKAVDYATGALVFGEPGTDAQHSFFQWLHQSPTPAPVDFIAAIKSSCGTLTQQNMLLANFLAQSAALMTGQQNTAAPHRNFSGNRPSNTILLDALTPHHLGLLLALYEHKVFVEGAIWGINSFDQWGVELGKVMAKTLQVDIENGRTDGHDGSTAGLLAYIYKKK